MSDEMKSSVTRANAMQELAAAVENLPLELRRIFVMAFVQKQPRATIAKALSLSIADVETMQTKALMTCTARLVEQFGHDAIAQLSPDPFQLAGINR